MSSLKILESYKILEIYGPNIISIEGVEWKQRRNVTSPSFNEKNNVLVFAVLPAGSRNVEEVDWC
jgi:hypothetical protein